MRKIRGAEEYPGETDELKRDSRGDDLPRQGAHRRAHVAFEDDVLQHQGRAVHGAPDHEIPGRAVPKAAEQHRDEEIAVTLELAVPVAAERDVEIVPQPG